MNSNQLRVLGLHTEKLNKFIELISTDPQAAVSIAIGMAHECYKAGLYTESNMWNEAKQKAAARIEDTGTQKIVMIDEASFTEIEELIVTDPDDYIVTEQDIAPVVDPTAEIPSENFVPIEVIEESNITIDGPGSFTPAEVDLIVDATEVASVTGITRARKKKKD